MGKKTCRCCNLRKRKDFNKKNSSPSLKCVLRLSCGVHGPIYGLFTRVRAYIMELRHSNLRINLVSS